MLNTYAKLIDKFTAYANGDNNISAAFVFGSCARSNHPADEYSDIDIIMVVADPEIFLTTDDWIKKIGRYHISFIENTIAGEKARRVLFDEAINIDFLIISKSNVKKFIVSDDVISFFKKGYNILVDKDGLSQHISKEFTDVQTRVMTEFEFANLVNDFWFHTVWAAKKLLRGELWTAKYCVDSYMKGVLLTLMESHARVRNGPDYNTWYNGRFIDTWADKQVLNELRNAFSHYEKDDIIRALTVTMHMFHWMALEIAEKLSYEYPYEVEKSAAEWIQKTTNLHFA